MNKKQLVGALIAFIFLGSFAYAKPKEQPQKQITADDIVEKMTKQLGLSDKQAIDVKPIIEEYLVKEKQLRLEEKRELSKVLTGQQLYTWNFLLNEKPVEKKKKGI